MNKKGFTTIEMILTIVLVIIIMASITSVTFAYRDKADYEERLSNLIDYKNTLTKIIYDDILYSESDIVRISRGIPYGEIDETDYRNIKLIKQDGSEIGLSIINEYEGRVGIKYNNVDYIIPESEYDLINISDIELKQSNVYGIYTVDITYSHKSIPEHEFRIHFLVS